MKKIIAPIDFSDSSLNALAFAAELARRTAAGLIIIHIFQTREEGKGAEEKMESVQAGLRKTYGPELTCEPSFRKGNFISVMKDVIASQDPDLIVMGTKGASGLKRILIGSNTVNVIAKTRFPVLVIPQEARFKNFLRKGKSRIVLATDLEEPENENALDILREIALMISEPQLKVLHVRPRNTRLDSVRKLERDRLLSFFSPELQSERITVFSDNVIRGINVYLNKHEDVGLIAMIATDSGALIQKHYTRALASQTHIPLLVVQDRKVVKSQGSK